MPSELTKRRPMEVAQSAQQNHRKTPQHVMPGLIPELVQLFRAPRKHFTLSAVRHAKRVSPSLIASALLHDLYDRVDTLNRRIGQAEAELSVREWKNERVA